MLQHWASEGKLYLGDCVLLKFDEPITFVYWVLYLHIRRNIALGRYLDARRNIFRMTYVLK